MKNKMLNAAMKTIPMVMVVLSAWSSFTDWLGRLGDAIGSAHWY